MREGGQSPSAANAAVPTITILQRPDPEEEPELMHRSEVLAEVPICLQAQSHAKEKHPSQACGKLLSSAKLPGTICPLLLITPTHLALQGCCHVSGCYEVEIIIQTYL